jgi:hypothetical protein
MNPATSTKKPIFAMISFLNVHEPMYKTEAEA